MTDDPTRMKVVAERSHQRQTAQATVPSLIPASIILLLCFVAASFSIATTVLMPERVDSLRELPWASHPWAQRLCDYSGCSAWFNEPSDDQAVHLSGVRALTQGRTLIVRGTLEKPTQEQGQMAAVAWPQLQLNLYDSAEKSILSFRVDPKNYLPKSTPPMMQTEEQDFEFSVNKETQAVLYNLEVSE